MISSSSNQQIKNIEKIKKSARERRKQGLYIVEGIRMFSEIPLESLDSCYVTEDFYNDNQSLFAGKQYELVSESVFKAISDTETPQGVLALVKMKDRTVDSLISGEKTPLLVILENLQDPGNLGTILRTAEAAGATGIIMSKDTVDIYNPKVVRATMGSIFRVPFAIADDIYETMGELKNAGIRLYAAHLKGRDFYEYDLRSASAFMIGNEGNGLTEKATTMADHLIKIPMCGNVESLNAATATTVIAYEALRQRISG
ncbi:MAG: RNA methyltransferase [Lachnospiraceae bacterium]|nr:RNA methyltransferase [Lachnospiraceae bacterium]